MHLSVGRRASAPTISANAQPQTWTSKDVSVFLSWLDLTEYKALFEQSNIDGEQLLRLDKANMASLGISKMGHRVRLHKAIQELQKAKREGTQRPRSAPLFRTESREELEAKWQAMKFLYQTLVPREEMGIKCVMGNDVSVLRIPSKMVCFKELMNRIDSAYSRVLDVYYVDQDGDEIKVTNDNLLFYALDDWKQTQSETQVEANGGSPLLKTFKLFLRVPDR